MSESESNPYRDEAHGLRARVQELEREIQRLCKQRKQYPLWKFLKRGALAAALACGSFAIPIYVLDASCMDDYLAVIAPLTFWIVVGANSASWADSQ